MAIDRIPLINLTPIVTQRLDLSNVTPLAPASVPAVVALAPYSTVLPEPELPLPFSSRQGFNNVLAVAAGEQSTPHDTSAMQVNQLFFSRQLVWHAPNPANLAASWRVMVRTYGEQRAALQEQARGMHVPGNVFMTEQNPAALRESGQPPLIMDAEAWRFAVYGWGGQRLMLRVLAGDPDQEAAQKRRHGKVALRLEMMLGELGRVVIQMEPLADGILLELAAAEAAALQHLRRLLPELVEAIGRSGLRIVRCHISKDLHAIRVHNNYPMQAAAASLSQPVFRAMAEVAVLLSRPQAQEAPQQEYADLELEPAAVMEVQEALMQEPPPLAPDLEPDLELEAEMQLELDFGAAPAGMLPEQGGQTPPAEQHAP